METKRKSRRRYFYWFSHWKEVVDYHESVEVGLKRKAGEVTEEYVRKIKRIKAKIIVIDK